MGPVLLNVPRAVPTRAHAESSASYPEHVNHIHVRRSVHEAWIWHSCVFTTQGVGQGSNLGPDISRRIIVGRHGGEISIDLPPGETVLRVWLPRHTTEAQRV